MPFSLSVQFEQWITAQKLGIFKFLFLFHFVIVFYSRSSRPLPARSLFLVVLHNGVKKIHVRKAWFVTCYRNREYAKNIHFLEIYIWKIVWVFYVLTFALYFQKFIFSSYFNPLCTNPTKCWNKWNSSSAADELFKCVWPFCGGWRLKG